MTSQPGWFKSSFSNASNGCVEVLIDSGSVAVRDSKYQTGSRINPIIRVSTDVWSGFLEGILRQGTGKPNSALLVTYDTDGTVALRSTERGTTLTYDSDEWEAFLLGVKAGEFDPDAVSNGSTQLNAKSVPRWLILTAELIGIVSGIAVVADLVLKHFG